MTRQELPAAGGREKLLDAAIELFARQGYGSTTSRQVASQAGVSLGLIHKHFGGMRGLLQATDDRVLQWIHERLAAELTALLTGGAQATVAPDAPQGHMASYVTRSLTSAREGSLRLLKAYEAVAIGVLQALGDSHGFRYAASLADCAHFLLAADLGLDSLNCVQGQNSTRLTQLSLLRNALLEGDSR